MNFTMNLFKFIIVLFTIVTFTGCNKVAKKTVTDHEQIIKAPVDPVIEEKIQEKKHDISVEDDDKNPDKSNDDQNSESINENHENDTELEGNEKNIKVALLTQANQKEMHKNALDAAKMAIFDMKDKASIDLTLIDANKSIEALEDDILGMSEQGIQWSIGTQSSEITEFTYGFLRNDKIKMLSLYCDNDCSEKQEYYNIAPSLHSQISLLLQEWKETIEKKKNVNTNNFNITNTGVIIGIMPNHSHDYNLFDKAFYYNSSDPKKAMEDLSKAISFIKKNASSNNYPIAIVLREGGWRLKRLVAELSTLPNVTIMIPSAGYGVNTGLNLNLDRSNIEIWHTTIQINNGFKERFYKNYSYYPSESAVYIYDAITMIADNMVQEKDIIGGSQFSLHGCNVERKIIINKTHK